MNGKSIPASSVVMVTLLFSAVLLWTGHAFAAAGSVSVTDFPPDLQSYNDAGQTILERLIHRVKVNPFNLVGTLIFLCAIIHTFLASKFTAISHRLEHEHDAKKAQGLVPRNSVSHGSRFMHFMGEVEVVFGLWALALMLSVVLFFDWPTAVDYISHKVNFTEALFVVVIMTLASTRPILKLSEIFMNKIAKLLGGSLIAWWLSILTFGPLLGSFITEPAAMTISALLLVRKFYVLEPSTKFKYATLGLLFVNISVGGTLTHFAAPPVLMVAEPWGWGIGYMMAHFGWKAAIGIVLANGLYCFAFRKEFSQLQEQFTFLSLKNEVLITHLSREEVEAAVDTIGAEIRVEGGYREELTGLVDEFVSKVKKQLEDKYMQSCENQGVDLDLARRAFQKRFEEIKLYRMRREFPHLLNQEQRAPFVDPDWDNREDSVPIWMMVVHIMFMGWTIFNAHHPELFIPGMLFFLGFAVVTSDYQNNVNLKPALLVGFFLGGLVTHGGVQGWWIEPVLGSLAELPLMVVATVLTAFNDNAAITYLSTLVPGLTDSLKYAVVAGAVTGGGLTVIANAPNPAGQSILKEYFENGVAPLGLLMGALVPTFIMFVIFFVLS
ncbi:MAG: putative Na+/H+ antiporter [Desulfuromusa sp.]|nr:putative Na+/H+ antiporter [Desulfuromusa sp.]